MLTELRTARPTFGPPKTEASRRTVHLPSLLTAELVTHVERFTADDGDALVFTSAHGLPLRRSAFYKVWHTARTTAGQPALRWHDLRHTAATLATVHGATVREVQARLGHSTPAAALRYQHSTAERDRLVAERLNTVISAAIVPM